MLAKTLLLGTAAFAAMVGAVVVRDDTTTHRRHSKILTDPTDKHTTKVGPPTMPAVGEVPLYTTKPTIAPYSPTMTTITNTFTEVGVVFSGNPATEQIVGFTTWTETIVWSGPVEDATSLAPRHEDNPTVTVITSLITSTLAAGADPTSSLAGVYLSTSCTVETLSSTPVPASSETASSTTTEVASTSTTTTDMTMSMSTSTPTAYGYPPTPAPLTSTTTNQPPSPVSTVPEVPPPSTSQETTTTGIPPSSSTVTKPPTHTSTSTGIPSPSTTSAQNGGGGSAEVMTGFAVLAALGCGVFVVV